ncbi:MAG: hypothetical protein HXY28_08110 [Hydrogenophilaceae bacterium]|jgi:hypothetical protein|nr:hypothetical protein [Hydrogenophilaceae bacterium]
MTARAILLLAAVLALTACGESQRQKAERARDTHPIGALLGEGACYSAAFNAAHLEAHPDQTLTAFSLKQAGEDIRTLDNEETRHVSFSFRLKGDSDLYAGIAGCDAGYPDSTCYVEGDGGEFRIRPLPNDDLAIEITRLGVEGPTRFSPNLYDAPGNRSLVLARAPASACGGD